MGRLLLLRHAQSEWNAEGRWQGTADPPLSRRGEQQAVLGGELLRPVGISVVASSDLRRARATAARMAAALGVSAPVVIEGDLREYDVGAWSGLTRGEIEIRWPEAIEDWRNGRLVATPGGERRDTFVARILAAVNRLAADRPRDTVLVITHGGVISAVCRSLGAGVHRFAHLAGAWVERDADGLRVGSAVSLLDNDGAALRGGEGTELAQTGVMDTGGR